MKLANFPLVISIFLMLVIPCAASAQITVTGDGVTLTYVSVDCAGASEVGIAVTGEGFTGQNLSVLNCASGGFTFAEDSTLTNSLAISDGDDVSIADTMKLTGTYNLFGDAAKAGDGTYSDGGSTSKWSASYADRIDAGSAIALLHVGSAIVGGDAAGNTKLYKCTTAGGVDIGALEKPCFADGLPGKVWDSTPRIYTVP